MIILGIDPGIAIVGYGVVETDGHRFRTLGMGAIRTEAGTDTEDRLQIIYHDMLEIIDTYHPEEMAVEELFFTNNQKTAIAVAEARGVILLAAKERALTMAEYTPLQVKESVTGYGKAEKKQVIAMTSAILGLPAIRLDDTADALALAICHAHCGASRIRDFYNQKKTRIK